MAKYRDKNFKFIIAGVSAAIIIALAATISVARYKRTVTRAEKLLSQGFSAVALEELKYHRKRMFKTEKGCSLYISVAFHARKFEQLEVASQSCLEKGIDIPEVYLGQAAVYEGMNRENDALQVLSNGLRRHGKVASLHFKIGQILLRQKNQDGGVTALITASRLGPKNLELLVEILSVLTKIPKWKEAREVADLVRVLDTDNPSIKLLAARALQNGGDPMGAENLVSQAKQLLVDREPATKAAIEESYKDVLAHALPAGR